MAELERRGWKQRRIAAEIGCSQAHVSKRLALLQPPRPGPQRRHRRAGVDRHGARAASRLSPALTTTSRPRPSPRRSTALRWAGGPTRPSRRPSATPPAPRRPGRPARTLPPAASRSPPPRSASRWAGPTSRTARPGSTRKAGCLAAEIGWNGKPEWICVNPASHPATAPDAARRNREAEDERESRKSAKARDAACLVIAAGPLPPAAELARILAETLLGPAGYSECMRLAARWLRDAGLAPAGADHYALRDKMTAGGDRAWPGPLRLRVRAGGRRTARPRPLARLGRAARRPPRPPRPGRRRLSRLPGRRPASTRPARPPPRAAPWPAPRAAAPPGPATAGATSRSTVTPASPSTSAISTARLTGAAAALPRTSLVPVTATPSCG